MSRFLASWAIRGVDDRVLEPSCGEASFLLAAAERLRALGVGLDLSSPPQLNGVEVHAASAAAAESVVRDSGFLPRIQTADFFDVEPTELYDCVLGNPPFIRYQNFAGDARIKALAAALTQGVRLTGLASAWAPFVVHAARFVKPTGRLALVLPAELLSVNYASEIRRFLLRRFASVRLVMFEELVFPGVLEEVVLLLAEGTGPAPKFEVYQATDLSDLDSVEGLPWTWFTPDSGGKWIPALLPAAAFATYGEITRGEHFQTLLDWGDTYLGAVTGNNRFFALTRRRARELKLRSAELLHISPPGSRHLRGMSFTERAWESLAEEDAACYLFAPNPKRPSEAAERYIELGERTKVHLGYKCKNREPWWRVPLVARPDLLLTYMDHDRPRLTTNSAKTHILNSLYGVKLHDSRRAIGMDLLPLASLNSLSLLGGEMVGRAYGGGLLKLEPKEADKLPLPALSLVLRSASKLRAIRPQLTGALRRGELLEAVRLVDRVLLIEELGLGHEALAAMRSAREILFARRATRGKKARGSH
jgi:tRNA1(Val) A37 N6-methylase TrmN6